MIPGWLFKFFKNRTFQGISFLFIVIIMANINALVDHFLHPEIPYFDREHLIVGGVYAAISTLLFGFIYAFLAELECALTKIENYEKLISICSYCKKIRVDNLNPDSQDSWKPIESFLFEKAQMEFSHGICPACLNKATGSLENM